MGGVPVRLGACIMSLASALDMEEGVRSVAAVQIPLSGYFTTLTTGTPTGLHQGSLQSTPKYKIYLDLPLAYRCV